MKPTWRTDYTPGEPEYIEEEYPAPGFRRVTIRTPWDHIILESTQEPDNVTYTIRDQYQMIGLVDECGATHKPVHEYLIDALRFLSYQED